jgi:hypothetical protein
MTDVLDEVPLDQQIKISRASYAGVPLQKIADYLGVTLAQVEAIVAIDQGFRKAESEFVTWVEANREGVEK